MIELINFPKAMKLRTWIITLGTMLLILIAGMFFAYPLLKPKKVLRIYQPSDINPKLVDESIRDVSKNHTISDFRLINQLGDTITQDVFTGGIYVANFFFVTCPTICPIMSNYFAELQQDFKDEPRVKFISHSVTPDLDSVPALAEYGERYGADPERWILATGDKKEIYNLARKSYFAVLDEGDGGVQDFIHTENMILVDSKRRIRGYYDGTSSKDMKRLRDEILILLEEENLSKKPHA